MLRRGVRGEEFNATGEVGGWWCDHHQPRHPSLPTHPRCCLLNKSKRRSLLNFISCVFLLYIISDV